MVISRNSTYMLQAKTCLREEVLSKESTEMMEEDISSHIRKETDPLARGTEGGRERC